MMRCFLVVAALSGLVVAGCSGPPSVLLVAYEGSDDGYLATVEAANNWNQACGVELVRVRRGVAIPFAEVPMRDQDGISNNAYGETVLERPYLDTFGAERPTSIWIMRGDYAVITASHEFGHALGLKHHASGIMQPGREWYQLDPATNYKTMRPELIGADECSRVNH